LRTARGARIAAGGTGTIIVGGSFTQIDGTGHAHQGEIQPSGAVVPKATWSGTADGDVQALAVNAGTLSLGGQFANVDAQPQPFVGAVSLSTGACAASVLQTCAKTIRLRIAAALCRFTVAASLPSR
jgi:hypothetical protein